MEIEVIQKSTSSIYWTDDKNNEIKISNFCNDLWEVCLFHVDV